MIFLINGENAIASTLNTNLSSGNNTAAALETAINANTVTHGATATAFNKLTSAVISNLNMSNTTLLLIPILSQFKQALKI